MIIDGHVHTPFCPHGTRDTLKMYIENAITKNYSAISFTEHAPLPPSFTDPVPTSDSAMDISDMETYITTLQKVKDLYSQDITIHIGLEVDYIEGYEKEITDFLNQYGPSLTDSILSVHFLKKKNGYVCLDYSPESFEELVNEYGSVQEVYKAYYNTVLQSVEANLGPFKPNRIGHMTLVQKFQRLFPIHYSFPKEVDAILHAIKKGNYSLDVNSAGLRKPYCQSVYPPEQILKKAKDLQLHLVYGSDAHKAEDLGEGHSSIEYFFTP